MVTRAFPFIRTNERESKPRWWQDFPIHAPEDEYVSRRDFTKFMVLTSLAFVVGQFWILAQNLVRRGRGRSPIMEIARLDAIPVGGTLVFYALDR